MSRVVNAHAHERAERLLQARVGGDDVGIVPVQEAVVEDRPEGEDGGRGQRGGSDQPRPADRASAAPSRVGARRVIATVPRGADGPDANDGSSARVRAEPLGGLGPAGAHQHQAEVVGVAGVLRCPASTASREGAGGLVVLAAAAEHHAERVPVVGHRPDRASWPRGTSPAPVGLPLAIAASRPAASAPARPWARGSPPAVGGDGARGDRRAAARPGPRGRTAAARSARRSGRAAARRGRRADSCSAMRASARARCAWREAGHDARWPARSSPRPRACRPRPTSARPR